uniref:(northern house mosquito) hypothetical protein n=1 Tax=Culex pipiens TaxID=7175 RepID=A0A8D8GKS6_CULPI
MRESFFRLLLAHFKKLLLALNYFARTPGLKWPIHGGQTCLEGSVIGLLNRHPPIPPTSQKLALKLHPLDTPLAPTEPFLKRQYFVVFVDGGLRYTILVFPYSS